MEDSTSNTLQEIEKLKNKISAYRDTLMTLKMGTSLEDYLIMQNEFDVLKSQISYIEGLTHTMDEKQNTQNEVYEEQMKQFSLQIAALNKTVEDMNQEILSISNKLAINKSVEIAGKNISAIREEIQANKSNSKLPRVNDEILVNNQASTVSNQPSYMQLRNLTRQVFQPQKNIENLDPIEHTEYKGTNKDRYFQSINTHPKHIYNGLYKNVLGKTPLRFKNTDENQDISTNNSEKGIISPTIDRAPGNVNTPSLNPIEPQNQSLDESNVQEASYHDSAIEVQTQSQPAVMPIEKINTEIEDAESKKQKNSLFFNFFRK
ncbi:hypothetical protein DCE79_16430 [Lysinibacillus sp. 2017]|uniref:hypothetical protein n=1 Tax=unclassified Lysinibacillus TaxID=2636778 RepID=UPI000D526F67|nr:MULTISPECIES: hypothetical protein [unclassified Lysinibacillus]AWE08840.1 hypothetical protein DCE79_16430 [Lysinibacillus sp. 2017]TGN36163.1 hypothetical protein E4L99_06810 [Lysinibacillus sp. S2017]